MKTVDWEMTSENSNRESREVRQGRKFSRRSFEKSKTVDSGVLSRWDLRKLNSMLQTCATCG